MGSSASHPRQRNRTHSTVHCNGYFKDNDVELVTYTSMLDRKDHHIQYFHMNFNQPMNDREFSRITASCPLPRKVFTPFPPKDQAIGSIVKSFDCAPPSLCYRRKVGKYPLENLCQRVECLFMPGDEGHLMVCSGLYVLRPELDALRVNSLYDGLVAQWKFGGDGQRDRCSVIKGSRSCGALNFVISKKGRFLAWPQDHRLILFDRYSGAFCRRNFGITGDTVKAVSISPDREHFGLISCYGRRFYFVITKRIANEHFPFHTKKIVELSSLDPTFFMPFTFNAKVHVRWSHSGRFIAISCSDGHFLIVPKSGHVEHYVLMLPHSFRVSGNNFEAMDLASLKAFDFAPQRTEDGSLERVAFGLASGEIVLCNVGEDRMEGEVTRIQFIPAPTPGGIGRSLQRINCLLFAGHENWLAVGLSTGEVSLLDGVTLCPVVDISLETAIFLNIKSPQTADHHGFCSFSFSCTDSYLAAGSTDGRVRVWCLKRMVGPLIELCRRFIRTNLTPDQIDFIPLPPLLQEYLGAEDAF